MAEIHLHLTAILSRAIVVVNGWIYGRSYTGGRSKRRPYDLIVEIVREQSRENTRARQRNHMISSLKSELFFRRRGAACRARQRKIPPAPNATATFCISSLKFQI
jgi:hypothetical protein